MPSFKKVKPQPWRTRSKGPSTGGLQGKVRAGMAGGGPLRRAKKEGPPRSLAGARGSGGDLLSRARRPGTIGDKWLDFRVRNGNGYDPPSMTAEISNSQYGISQKKRIPRNKRVGRHRHQAAHAQQSHIVGSKGKASRAISIARLNASPRLHLRPIDVIVFDGPSGGCPRETLSWERLHA